jgi:5-amino-6-(5-phospho-D-ribitylamino)uracil phosphatase
MKVRGPHMTIGFPPLFVTDLDGTFLTSTAQVSETTRDVVSHLLARGVQITFATARSPLTALPILRQIPFSLPAIVYNGTFLADPATGRLVDGVFLQNDAVELALAEAGRRHLSPIVFHIEGGRDRVTAASRGQTPGTEQFFKDRPNDPRFTFVPSETQLPTRGVFQVGIIGNYQEITSLEASLGEALSMTCHINVQRESYHPEHYWLELTDKAATKAGALQRLAATVPHDRLICFGDNHNDLSLFAIADQAVAVANAEPAVLAKATEVTSSNNDDGVARWLLAYFEGSDPSPSSRDAGRPNVVRRQQW